jgi:LysR family transcriptional regulator for metE and metH
MRHLTLRQLRALAATVRHGSLSGAARALAVTPPAVTLQLQQLENLAGLPLLQRTAAGAVPTEAGREVVALCERIELAIAECQTLLDAMRGLTAGRVCVGVVSTAKYFAPFVLAEFARTHPGIDVRLVVGNREEVVAGLESLDIDVAVMGRPPAEMEVEQLLIGNHPHVVIAPPTHPAVGHRCAAKALAGETFLLREPGSGTRMLSERFFANTGIKPRIGMEIGSNETIKQAVMAGLGIALISAHTIAAEIDDGRLAVLDIDGLPIVRKWFVIRRKDKRLLPATQAVRDFLASEAERFLPVVEAHPAHGPSHRKNRKAGLG